MKYTFQDGSQRELTPAEYLAVTCPINEPDWQLRLSICKYCRPLLSPSFGGKSLTPTPDYSNIKLRTDETEAEKMSDFKVGDVVRLRSGSPKMVVVELVGSTKANCAWIGYGTGIPYQYIYPVEALIMEIPRARAP